MSDIKNGRKEDSILFFLFSNYRASMIMAQSDTEIVSHNTKISLAPSYLQGANNTDNLNSVL